MLVAWPKLQNIFIRTAAFVTYNLYLWRLLNNDCYVNDTLFDVFKYFLISIVCCAGLWLATTDVGLRYKKITSILILPSFAVTPIFVTAEYYSLTALVVSGGSLALIRIFRGTNEKMATGPEKRSLFRSI
jgi:hypothetical protein